VGKLLLGFVVLLALAVWAGYALAGLWGVAGVVGGLVALGLVIKSMAGKLLEKAFTAPFVAKGAVLRDARIEVHALEPADPPSRSEEDDDEDFGPLHWLQVDLTVIPGDAVGPFTMWEPGELRLTGEDGRPGADGYDNEEEECGRIAEIRLWKEDRWIEDDGAKYEGPQRLKLHVGVKSGARRVRLRYYFEVFGLVDLSGAAVHA
jgi:hypothetical protein